MTNYLYYWIGAAREASKDSDLNLSDDAILRSAEKLMHDKDIRQYRSLQNPYANGFISICGNPYE